MFRIMSIHEIAVNPVMCATSFAGTLFSQSGLVIDDVAGLLKAAGGASPVIKNLTLELGGVQFAPFDAVQDPAGRLLAPLRS